MDYPIKTLSQLRPILKGFRKAAGMTQSAVADHLGVTQQTYAQLEANPAAISVERLFKVLRVLGVDCVLSPAGVEPTHSIAAMRPNTTDISRPPAKKASARKSASGAGSANVRERAPSQAKKSARSISAGATLSEAQKRRPPPKAATKKRENW